MIVNVFPCLTHTPIDKNVMVRRNMDSKIDSRGKELLDCCVTHQWRILNGRTLGDLNGKYTCCTPNGASVVDYSIVSEGALDLVLYFKVTDFTPTLSNCHCRIEWEMSSDFCPTNDVIDESNLHRVPLRYMCMVRGLSYSFSRCSYL